MADLNWVLHKKYKNIKKKIIPNLVDNEKILNT